jgi:cysteine-rich repeat protein
MFARTLRRRLVRRLGCCLLIATPVFATAPLRAAEPTRIPWILADDFELESLCLWSDIVGGDPGLPLCFLCGDGLLDLAEGEQCDDFNTDPGDGCSATCQVEICGNGVPEALLGEGCDDGNLIDDDECRNNCQLPICGDTVTSTGEACDSGGNSAGCNFDCTLPSCGDAIVNKSFVPPSGFATEVCDDGGTSPGDGCSPFCQLEQCLDGVVNRPNEQCDDGDLVQTNSCTNHCQNARCGDGFVRAGVEACDLGGGNSAGCDYDCTLPQCGAGDGIVNFAAGEQCDDNNLVNGDGCSNLCQLD